MGQHVQHIAQCHTQYDTTDTQCQKGELPFDEIHHRESKEGSEHNR